MRTAAKAAYSRITLREKLSSTVWRTSPRLISQPKNSMTAKGPSAKTSKLERAVIAHARKVTTWATKRAKMKARRGAIGVPLTRELRYEARKVITKIQTRRRTTLKGIVTSTR